MKALTLTQPHASLVAIGAKTIAARSRATAYRGPLAIHAAVRETAVTDPYHRSLLAAAGCDCQRLPTGVFLAVCALVHCETITPANCPCYPQYAFDDFMPGRFSWHFAEIIPLLEPIPARGHGGLWTLPEEWDQSLSSFLAPGSRSRRTV